MKKDIILLSFKPYMYVYISFVFIFNDLKIYGCEI